MKIFATILALLITWGAFAQQPITQKTGAPNILIRNLGAGSFDSAVYLPDRDTTFTPSMPSCVIIRQADGLMYSWTGGPWKVVGTPVWGKINGNLPDQTDLYDSLQVRQRALANGYGWVISGGAGTFDSAHVRKVDTMYRVNDSTVGYTINGIPYTALLRGTAAGGISSLVLTVPTVLFSSPITFSNSGGNWTGSLVMVPQNPNTFLAGPTSGAASTPTMRVIGIVDLPTGIPNGNLQNAVINFSMDQLGTTPSFSATSVALGNTLIFHNPWAGPASSGPLTSADWNRFNSAIVNVVTSVNGQIGGVIVRDADSLGNYPIDFTNFHNNWVLSVDTIHSKLVFLAPGSGSGITTLNGLNPVTQNFAIGYTGTSFNISSVTATHTFNIPILNSADTGLATPAQFNLWNSKEPAITPINTPKYYWNGYKLFVPFNTDSIPVGSTNLYFTNALARNAISLTLTGTNGSATYSTISGILNIPQYQGLLGSSGSGYRLFNPGVDFIKTLTCTGCTLDSTNTGQIGITVTGTAPTWQQTLTTGSTLTGANTIVNTGQTFNWNNGGTGLFKFNNFYRDTSNSFGVMTAQNDSSISKMTWAQVTAKIVPLLPTFNIVPWQGTKVWHGSNDTLAFGGTLSEPDTLDLAFNPLLWLNVPNESTAAGTDSGFIKKANGKMMVAPLSAFGGGGSSLPVTDNTAIVKGTADNTKQVKISAAGITTGTTRTVSVQDANYTAAGIDIAQTFGPVQTFTLAPIMNALPVASRVMTDPVTKALTTQPEIIHQPVHYAAVAALSPLNTYNNVAGTLTATGNGLLIVDGDTVKLNDRLIVTGETDSTHNGLYSCTTQGDGSHAYILTRGSYATAANLKAGTLVMVDSGLVYKGELFEQTLTGTITFGTSKIMFAPAALNPAKNLADVANAAAAVANLGIVSFNPINLGFYSTGNPDFTVLATAILAPTSNYVLNNPITWGLSASGGHSYSFYDSVYPLPGPLRLRLTFPNVKSVMATLITNDETTQEHAVFIGPTVGFTSADFAASQLIAGGYELQGNGTNTWTVSGLNTAISTSVFSTADGGTSFNMTPADGIANDPNELAITYHGPNQYTIDRSYAALGSYNARFNLVEPNGGYLDAFPTSNDRVSISGAYVRSIPLNLAFYDANNAWLCDACGENFWVMGLFEAWMVANAVTTSSIQVKWQSNYPSATGYKIYRDVSMAFSSPTLIYSGTGNVFTDTGLATNTVYYYKEVATIGGVDTFITTFPCATRPY